jgi:3'(2'), 5'-bisphosphate nucleotidase
MPINRQDVLDKLFAAAAEAAKIVMNVYSSADVGAELKGPNDPVTRADKEANAFLIERLQRDFPGIPIVAEESDPSTFKGFGDSPCALFVDPVDGTRDFIAKNGEFAVMLGFAEEGQATVGVVDCPALGEAYGGARGIGSICVTKSGRADLKVSALTDLADCLCAVSRFHRSKSVDAKLNALGVKQLVPTGSAGLKGVRLASGAVDIYAHPSTGAVKLWDACAPEAIVHAAGGIYSDGNGKPFDYRGAVAQGAGTLAANPTLHAEALRRFAATPRLDGKR